MAGTFDSNLLLVAVGLVVLVLVVFVYAIRRFRLQANALRAELSLPPRMSGDRAFNMIRLAASEADILARSGTDVDRPRALIRQAQTRLDRRDPSGALDLAQTAHDQLVSLRSGVALPSDGSERRSAGPSGETAPIPDMGPRARNSEHPAPEPPKFAKNQAESHFQMTLLASDLARARDGTPDDPMIGASEGMQGEAQRAYAAGNYTEAMRIALKARRTLGGRIDTLAAPRSAATGSAVTPSPGPDSATSPTPAPGDDARCSACGRPLAPNDKFCRGCGTPRVAGRCPRCGTPLVSGDAYCGGCGAPVD